MGFAQHTHSTYQNKNSGMNNLTFFGLRVRPDEKSPETWFQVPDSQGNIVNQIWGNYEIVWFLNSLGSTPIYRYHKTKTRDEILCAAMFEESGGACPVCEQVEQTKENYMVNGKIDYKAMPIKWAMNKIITPVYVPRRAKEKHIYKGNTEVAPIYWFVIDVDKIKDDHPENYYRLRDADLKWPISQYPYMIFKAPKVEGKKAEYHFQALNFDPNTMGIYYQHPLLMPPYIPDINNPTHKNWGMDYTEGIMELLPLLHFKRWVDPQTNEVYPYFGHYQRALDLYESCKTNWPPSARKLTPEEMPQSAMPFIPAAVAAQPTQGHQPTPQLNHGAYPNYR